MTMINNSNDRAAVQNLLITYSKALNSADADLLAKVYSDSGMFMPSGFHNLSGKEEIKHSAERFFKDRQINISFEIQDISFDGNYAFVQATSNSTVHHHRAGDVANNSNKDFFVLRKEVQEWKVYRYMFNA
jgi:uncharacterized protein (TIGR02246 family)